MKRMLAVLLTSCVIVGLASPAGSGIATQIAANAEAGAANIAADSSTESVAEIEEQLLADENEQQSGQGEFDDKDSGDEDSEDSNESADVSSFDESISALYDSSMDITDEEILSAAEQMPSDFDKVEETITSGSEDLINAVKAYEAAKGLYLSDGATEQSSEEAVSRAADIAARNIAAAANTAKTAVVQPSKSNSDYASLIQDEWDKQKEYTSYVVPADSVLEAVIPKVKITSCEVSEESGQKKALLEVYEWTTIGYSVSDAETDSVDAAAYGYEYSIEMTEGEDGWQVAGIADSDQNFEWLEDDSEYDPEQESGLEADAGAVSSLVTSEDGQKDIMAAFNVTSYTYNRAAAIAYADKYCKSYNTTYNNYKGKGGDCANFVSQCLYAGGIPMDDTWFFKNTKNVSTAWINVMAQINFLKNYGTFMTANNNNILAGNPVWFDWKGGVYDHATICVGRNSSGTAIIDSHTSDLYHATWNHWKFNKAATIQLRDSATATTTAASGSWQKDSKGTWYRNADGSYPKSNFVSIDGKTYYFNSNGYLVKGWQKVSGKWYFMNTSTGEMMTGWIKVNGKLYYLQSNGAAYSGSWQTISGKKYYFDSSCAAATGFAKVGGKKYYFDGSGAMQTGWVTVSGKKYYLGDDGVVRTGWKIINSRRYYFNANGEMQTGKVSIDGQGYDFGTDGAMAALISAGSCKVKLTSTTASGSGTAASSDGSSGWIKVGSSWMYFRNGKPGTGWQKISGKWYYLGSGGTMKTGWQKISGKWYYLASNGVMKTGWVKVSGKWYYLASSGAMKTGWQKISGKWYYLGSSGAMKTGWAKVNGKWYYLASNGVMKTGWVKVSGKWYYLSSGGAMKTGWVTVGGKKYYLHSSGAMATGLTSIGGGKYYFNSNGTIRTGWVTVGSKKYFFSPSRGGRCATGDWDINGKIYHFGSDGALKK